MRTQPSSQRPAPDALPTLFIKPGCPWCTEALDALRRLQVPHATVDVRADPAAFARMVELSGQTKAPTLDWQGEILADFGEAELLPFLRAKGIPESKVPSNSLLS
jgi:glutaredoxin